MMVETTNKQLILDEQLLNTHFAEAYRALRANIAFSTIDRPVKTILITSAAPLEGKTTTVINLGIIMAQAGPKVVIVDADFRRSSLDQVLGVTPDGQRFLAGLSNVIVGSRSLDEVIVPTGFAGLSLLPAGEPPAKPAELLGSEAMRVVISQLAARADIVLLDSPPCLIYSDALVLSRMTDGVLYVLRAGRQDKAAQRRVQKQLLQAKAQILGVVFNDVEAGESTRNYA